MTTVWDEGLGNFAYLVALGDGPPGGGRLPGRRALRRAADAGGLGIALAAGTHLLDISSMAGPGC